MDNKKELSVIVACGGTGGHAFPGVAAAEELASRGHDVTVWDSGRSVESSVIRNWKGNVFSTGAKQLSAGNAFANIRSILRCRKEMRKARPDVLLAMGSYSSLPPVLAARACGVPVVLHEANTVPGKAVDFLSRFAETVAISFPSTSEFLPGVETVCTGLPVRAGIASGTRFPSIPPNAFTVFVTGGSQGAHAVNLLASEALARLHRTIEAMDAPGKRPLYVIHQTGAADEGMVMAAYAKAGVPSRVKAFEDEMANAFASADVVVARAGASTCFELAACGKCSLLVPLPSAVRNHQHFNAEAFASIGAADEGTQAKLTVDSVANWLLSRYRNPAKIEDTGRKIKSLATPDAAKKLADAVEEAVRRRGGTRPSSKA